jgi:hypothetical protein
MNINAMRCNTKPCLKRGSQAVAITTLIDSPAGCQALWDPLGSFQKITTETTPILMAYTMFIPPIKMVNLGMDPIA